jgi:hypothetical protein
VTVKGEGPLVLVDFRCGVMVTPEFAALFDFAFAGTLWKGPEPPSEADGWTITEQRSGEAGIPLQLHVGASAQVFVVAPFWVRGGLGVGVMTYDLDTKSEGNEVASAGLGVLAGFGLQLSQRAVTDRTNRAPSLEVQYIGGPLGEDAYAHGATLGLGYQWY